jgi:hypothetical protein
LCAAAEDTTHGVRFRSNPWAIEGGLPAYPSDLYDGAAGVALALLDWQRFAGDRTSRALLDRVGEGLVASAPPGPSGQPTGLYIGLGGLAILHLRRAEAFADPEALGEAVRLARLIAAAPPAASDLLHGAAGAGSACLAVHIATGDEAALGGVHAHLDALARDAVASDGGLAWPLGQDAPADDAAAGAPPGKNDRQTGFAHGVAGIAVFLAQAAYLLRDRGAARMRDGAYGHLLGTMRRRGSAATWPVSDVDATSRLHWCHGTTGIAHAWLAAHRTGAHPEALQLAAAAGTHTWRALTAGGRLPTDRWAGHCHGLAGALECFDALHRATGDAQWRLRAGAVVRAIRARAGAGRNGADLGGEGNGLAYGTAGIVRALLQCGGADVRPPWEVSGKRLPFAPRLPGPAPLPPFLARPSPRPAPVRLPRPFDRARVVPHVGGRLASVPYALPPSSPWDEAAARFADRFLRAPEGQELRGVIHRLARALSALEARHRQWLGPGALAEGAVGRVVRECAGILLHRGARARRHRARVVGRIADRYAAALTRCRHVARDRAGPSAPLPEGRLLRVVPMGNDPHRGGQVVFSLAFEDGREVLYKPRSLAVDWFLASSTARAGAPSAATMLARWLPTRMAGAGLPRHEVIAAGCWHGYAERVATTPEPVPDPHGALTFAWEALGAPPPEEAARLAAGDERRFWYNAGLLAAHAACFGIADLHGENLVCGRSRAAPRPALHAIDLEVAFIEPSSVGDAGLAPPYGHPRTPPPDAHTHYGLQARHPGLCTMGAEEWSLLATPEGLRPAGRPGVLAARAVPNAVMNADGSFGYGPWLAPIVRGFVDYWTTVRARAATLAAHARAELAGAPLRVLVNASRAYVGPLRARQLGVPLWPGAAFFDEYGVATPFGPEERRQLDALDVPYFFERLGSPGARWLARPPEGEAPAHAKLATTIATPYWSVIERFAELEALAYGVADIVAYGAPAGPLDQRDDRLGVRVTRPDGDARLHVAVRRDEDGGSWVFRLDPEGEVRWWERSP